MKIPRTPHRWSVSPKQAIAIQNKLAPKVRPAIPSHDPRFVVGTDLAFSPDATQCIAAAVCWDSQNQTVVEQQVAVKKLTFPYVPGLLSFRECPTILAGLRKLKHQPDAIMCDGHGLAHPRRFGIACHVGIITGLPTIGCGKSRLTGTHKQPDQEKGSTTPLIDKGEIVGSLLRTRTGVKPVFVSVGHLIDLVTAVKLTLKCATQYRLPEPTRLADRLVAQIKKDMTTH